MSNFYLVGMLVVFIQFQPGHHSRPQLVFGQHVINSIPYNFSGIFFQLPSNSDRSYPSGIAAETVINFPVYLLSGYPDLIAINNNSNVPPVNIGSPINFIFAAKNPGNFCCQPSHCFVFSIKQMIFAVYGFILFHNVHSS